MEPTDHINYIDSISITVYDTLVSLDPSKAQGIDLISPKVIQTCAPILCQLCTIFSQCPLNMHGRSTRLYQFSKLVTKLQSRTTDLFISKVLEQLVFNKIVTHLTSQISPHQFGFIRGASTLQQLLIFLDFLTNSPTQINAINLDIRKAFDTVSHGILLSYLWSFGITGTLWSWFKCYLTD